MKIIKCVWYICNNGFSSKLCIQREDKKWTVVEDKYKEWVNKEAPTEDLWFNSFKKVCNYIEKKKKEDMKKFIDH